MFFRGDGSGSALSFIGRKSRRMAIWRIGNVGKCHGIGFAFFAHAFGSLAPAGGFLAPVAESPVVAIRLLADARAPPVTADRFHHIPVRLLADGHGLLVTARESLSNARQPLNIVNRPLNIGHEYDNIVINLLSIGHRFFNNGLKPPKNASFHHVANQTHRKPDKTTLNPPLTMPDSPSSSSTATPRPRGYFNKAQLEDIAIAEDILPPTSDATRAAAFASRDITAAYIAGLAEAVAQARAKTSETGQDADQSQAATLSADDAERALITVLQSVQSAAKQKHRMLAEDDDDTTNFSTDGYLIGKRLNANRALLLQNAAALKGKAQTDALPGFGTAASIQVITDAIADYKDATADQAEADREAGEDRIARDKLVRKINARRLAIQHAADSLWPYTDEDNGPIRVLFHLPRSRPLTE